MVENKINHIHLIGDPEENLFLLGKRDKSSFEQTYQHISRLCIRNEALAKIVRITTEFSHKFVKKNNHPLTQDLKAYAEGLERPFTDVLFAQVLPEMVAAFNKWSPNLISLVPGCSSLFTLDPKTSGVIHTRILDYALSGPFEENERSILYEFGNRHKVFSYSSSGLSLPGLSAMNDQGLTLALHYKHSDYFNQEGESIFCIASDILYQCSTIRDAIKYLRNKKSISYWGMYLSDRSGEILAVDICGNEMFQEKFDIQDHPYLYFNNRSIVQKMDKTNLQPFGGSNQCLMRNQSLKESLTKKPLQESKNLMIDTLKLLGTPNVKKVKNAKNWKMHTLTPSSIQFYNFNNANFSSNFVTGLAPKFFNHNYIEYKNIFKNLKTKNIQKSSKIKPYEKGLRFLSNYQVELDKNNITDAYHNIQMAILLLKGYEEQFIAEFYFYVTEYIYEVDQRDYTYLYESFLSLENKLPPYLEDHRILFLLRLSKLIGHQLPKQYPAIKNKNLIKIYEQEFKLNGLAIKGLKYLIFPRVEILDIIYAY